MLKKILLSIVALVVIVVAGGFVFQEPLKEFAYQQATKEMFVDEDGDDFEPGVPGTQVGNQMMPVRVAYSGGELTSLTQFSKSRGLVVIFSRSVVW